MQIPCAVPACFYTYGVPHHPSFWKSYLIRLHFSGIGDHTIAESQTGCSWKWPLEVIWSAPLLSRATYSWLSRAMSRWLLNISKDRDSTTSPSSLCQCSVTLTVEKSFLMFRWNRQRCREQPGFHACSVWRQFRRNLNDVMQSRQHGCAVFLCPENKSSIKDFCATERLGDERLF